MDFEVTYDGTIRKVEDYPLPSSIERIIKSLILSNKIMKMLIPTSHEYTLDVTNRSIMALLPAVLRVNR